MHNKYEVLGVVGEGAYGIVYKCRNKETKEIVAIKKFKETEDELVKKTMKRELKVLQILKHENIVEFKEAFKRKNNLFLVFEFVEKTLLELLEEQPTGLDPQLIRKLIYQLCKGVKYLHDQKIIHRDVKPENLLIKNDSILKICDFGFARKIQNKNEALTDYVATRWYRSPELLITNGYYGIEVDYWAIGCIMGELADGNPLFPGENETDQLHCIQKVLGNLPEDQVEMFYKNQLYVGNKLLDIKKPETLEKRYMGKLPKLAISFMKGLLELNPKKRLCGEKVFQHKYFAGFPDNIYYNNNNSTQYTINDNQDINKENNSNLNNNLEKNCEEATNKYSSEKSLTSVLNNDNIIKMNTFVKEKDICHNNSTSQKFNSNNNNTTNISIININNYHNSSNKTENCQNSNINLNNNANNNNENASCNNIIFKNIVFPNNETLKMEKQINSMAMTMTNKFPLSLQNKYTKNQQINFTSRKSYDVKNNENDFQSTSSLNLNNSKNLPYRNSPQTNSMLMGYKTFYSNNKKDNLYNYNINLNFSNNGNINFYKPNVLRKKNSQKTSIIEEEDEDDLKINTKKSKSLNQKTKHANNNISNFPQYNNNIHNLSNIYEGSPVKDKNKYSMYLHNKTNYSPYKNNNTSFKNGNFNPSNKPHYSNNSHNMPNISCYNGFKEKSNNNANNHNNNGNGCYLPSLKNMNINNVYNNNFKKFYQMINK